MDRAHDDDFGLRKAIVPRVVAMKVYAQALRQVVPARADLRMLPNGVEAILDLANQLRRGLAVVLGDEAPDLDKILFGAFGRPEASRSL